MTQAAIKTLISVSAVTPSPSDSVTSKTLPSSDSLASENSLSSNFSPLEQIKSVTKKIVFGHISLLNFFGYDAFVLSKHIEKLEADRDAALTQQQLLYDTHLTTYKNNAFRPEDHYILDPDTNKYVLTTLVNPTTEQAAQHEYIEAQAKTKFASEQHEHISGFLDNLSERGCTILCSSTSEELWKKGILKCVSGFIVVVAVSVLVLSAKNNPKDFWNARTIFSTTSLLFILPLLWDYMKTKITFLFKGNKLQNVNLYAFFKPPVSTTSPETRDYIHRYENNIKNIGCYTMILLLVIGLIVGTILLAKRAHCPTPPPVDCPEPPE